MDFRRFFLLALLTVSVVQVVAGDSENQERGYFGYVATYEEAPEGQGQIHVLEVYDGGPAEVAGLMAGDRIYQVGGETFQFKNDLEMIRRFTSTPPGERLPLEWRRGGKVMQGVLTVGKQPGQRQRELGQWIKKAEGWFEQGGREQCREDQKRQHIYADLVKRASGNGLLLLVGRPRDLTREVTYTTAEGEVLPLDKLENTFLDALAQELPAGQTWELVVRAEEQGLDRTVLVVIPQSGPRAGRRGLIENRVLRAGSESG